jgi:putative hydrolase of the HAD superfamily
MKYRHIFFDLDRTLWDFETNAFLTLTELYNKHGLKERGIAPFDDFLERYKRINIEMWDGYGKGTITKEMLRNDRFQRAFAEFGVHDKELSLAFGSDYVKLSPARTALFPYAADVLAYLSEKYELHILTNGFEEVQHIKLERSGIRKHFKEVITSERAGFKKPDQRMFGYAMQAANAQAGEALMIGDSLDIDIAGARDSGIDQVFFNPAKEKHAHKVTYEIGCLSELKNIL